ncbi:hypothetical protein COLO4_19685 [Corchorus olitorius]|uniref:Endonuclease/exonuclease/phosphatase n=1 Tax=Corchorus olitorius TaxID=93759 RepID=A0A1R3J413_9ROSI|nr:hypothetical protein COLO4_19685 [Corchorus olitorius]
MPTTSTTPDPLSETEAKTLPMEEEGYALGCNGNAKSTTHSHAAKKPLEAQTSSKDMKKSNPNPSPLSQNLPFSCSTSSNEALQGSTIHINSNHPCDSPTVQISASHQPLFFPPHHFASLSNLRHCLLKKMTGRWTAKKFQRPKYSNLNGSQKMRLCKARKECHQRMRQAMLNPTPPALSRSYPLNSLNMREDPLRRTLNEGGSKEDIDNQNLSSQEVNCMINHIRLNVTSLMTQVPYNMMHKVQLFPWSTNKKAQTRDPMWLNQDQFQLPSPRFNVMSILVWNCRGERHPDFVSTALDHITLHKPIVAVVTETRVRAAKARKIFNRLPFDTTKTQKPLALGEVSGCYGILKLLSST